MQSRNRVVQWVIWRAIGPSREFLAFWSAERQRVWVVPSCFRPRAHWLRFSTRPVGLLKLGCPVTSWRRSCQSLKGRRGRRRSGIWVSLILKHRPVSTIPRTPTASLTLARCRPHVVEIAKSNFSNVSLPLKHYNCKSIFLKNSSTLFARHPIPKSPLSLRNIFPT